MPAQEGMSRHAYLIMAHNEPEVLMALLRSLDVEWNDVYLHIDRRSTQLRQRMQSVGLSRARLFVLPRPIKVYWGHVSQIRAELLLLKEAAARGPYAYYHLLSGCDMPIKPAREIYDFFERHRGREFIGFWNSERDRLDAIRKTRYYYLLNRYKKRTGGLLHLTTTPLRNLLLGVQKVVGVNRRHGPIRKGFNWFSITEGFCRYVLDHESLIWATFRYTLCGDEMFMQTLIWDSPFRANLYDTEDAQRGSMRAIDWERGTPYVWQAGDVDYLLRSPYLFARKFSSSGMEAVRRITAHLGLPCRRPSDNARTIAFVHGQFPCGGAEKVTLDVGRYLHGRGYRVIVLCREFLEEAMPADSPVEVRIIRHKLKRRASADELVKVVKEMSIGVLVYVCIHPFFTFFIKDATGVRIVSANHGVPFWEALGKNARLERMKSGRWWQRLRWHLYYRRRCCRLHVYDQRCHRDYARTLAEVDAYTVLCPEYRDEICRTLRLGDAARRKIHVIGNYQEPVEHPRLEKEEVVLYMGRLTYTDKRVDRLLSVWARVQPRHPRWRLLIVGDGAERKSLEAMSRRLGLKNVSFEGRQMLTQPYYDRAALLCLTSQSEGWGLVLTEAQANGVVPLAFDCSAGVRNLLQPSGTGGILVPPFDMDEYARQLFLLMDDERLRHSIQHHIIQRRYDMEDVGRKHFELYESLL